ALKTTCSAGSCAAARRVSRSPGAQPARRSRQSQAFRMVLSIARVKNALPYSFMKRLALLVLVVAIVVAAKLLFQHPVDVDLSLVYGSSAPEVRATTLVFTD